ncbi:gamma-glutamyl phosphate reductase [Paucilactobacillus hokkaidonensis JCM 18461]|uniref:Gamma-glutamyl phosphate reductase n=2 Tax=Paucilactobacillus hokkaidonensis TaxID=1193095 RepID=A0A0A1GWE0_9LACO|nr:glutamate-5-semialdehyde dehydrogenase [Paucilactobacillus hokkaidonensis]KRO08192.1 gamma-glutamyl phosphate reductase [Paucilactobacillus hokkaidonensis]BAP86567.1 gamma-glutamyl phosphate reductase [Paucilactobacillus hokkaidonensis JCM 18461]
MDNLEQIGQAAQQAEQQLSQMKTSEKNDVLRAMAKKLRQQQDEIIKVNQNDLATATDIPANFVDRLTLNEERIEQMAQGLEQVAALPDPIGNVDKMWRTEDGLQIGKQRVPIGVIGIIYEARPNVTVDAFALTFKSGNTVVLRGGKEALQTNSYLVECLQTVLRDKQLNEAAVQILHDTSHETAQKLMELTEYLDVLIPRGSSRLIKSVVQHAKVPVIETGAGNCHIYVDEFAQLKMATDIVVNAKTQRPSVCNAAEKLVIHSAVAKQYLPTIAQALAKFNVELRGDDRAREILPTIGVASEDDWGREYNDYIMAIKVVDSVDEAIKHINHYNTKHSEAIVTDNYENSQQFLQQIDAACVYVNASTRFTDGFKFGFGAEIGISTQKLHARGPMGLNELTSSKYIIYGNGQIRA